jgi:hypothetical protein
MKKLLYQCLIVCGILIINFSCSKDLNDLTEDAPDSPLTLKEMESKVLRQLDQGHVFYWNQESDHTVWSAGMLSDSLFSIGYKPAFIRDVQEMMHILDISQNAWKQAKFLIEHKILEAERINLNKPSLTLTDIAPMGDVRHFPQIIVRITSSNLIQELRSMPQVRYVEPLGFNLEDLAANYRSGSGCSGNPNYNINNNDYQTISPMTKAAWNFYIHDIDLAWTQAQGDDATICIIDTGASNNQDNLGSQFTSGDSGGRYVQKFSTHYSGAWWWRSLDSPHDQCGHGTSMAGLATAPRSSDGNSVGVAYKANLISIRAVADVVISTSNERVGVRDALYLAANRSDVQIVSMSIGTPFYSSTVADGIYYAYNQGLMLFAAAGTSFSWTSWFGVIFPATMSQTIAVTGVKDSPNNVKCSTCHSGSQVDFVIVMERTSDENRNSIALATSSNQPKYIGGSSAATATAAGIAGLVWGENPSFNRSDVMNALKLSSEYYPARHSQYGWGRINASDALGGPQ